MKRILQNPLLSPILLLGVTSLATCAVASDPADEVPATTQERLVERGASLDVAHGRLELTLRQGDSFAELEVPVDGYIEVAATPSGDVSVAAVDLHIGTISYGNGLYPDGFFLREAVIRSKEPHWCRSATWSDDVCDAQLTADLYLAAELWTGDDMWLPLEIPIVADLDLLMYDASGLTAGHLGGEARAGMARTLPLGLPGVNFDLDLQEHVERTAIY